MVLGTMFACVVCTTTAFVAAFVVAMGAFFVKIRRKISRKDKK